MAVAFGVRAKPYVNDPLLELLWKRGRDHEQRYVDLLRAEGRTLAELTGFGDPVEHIEMTLEEMHKGTHTIVQGGLSDGHWFGRPDIMRRVERPSSL